MLSRADTDDPPDAKRWIVVVCLVTAVVAVFFAYLVTQMPQGLRLTSGMAHDAAISFLLGGVGLYLLRSERTFRLGLLAISLANLAILHSLTLLAQLVPGYVSRTLQADALLQRWDTALGFDWLAYFHFHLAHPVFARLTHLAYKPLFEMGFVVLFVVAIWGDAATLCRYVITVLLSLSIVFLVGTTMPAYGPYVMLGLTPADHMGLDVQFSQFKSVFDALRAGIIDIYADQIPAGTIAFPSFHTTVVILYSWASWKTPFRWPAIVIQGLSALAIPVQGTHYLSDMIMGAIVGVFAIGVSFVLIPTSRRVGSLAGAQRQLVPAGAPEG